MKPTILIDIKRVFKVLLLLIIVCGCSRNNTAEYEQKTPAAIGKADAINIAKDEALKRNWSKIEVEGAVFTNGCWEIDLLHVPYIPGGFARVYVTSMGKVTAYHGGE